MWHMILNHIVLMPNSRSFVIRPSRNSKKCSKWSYCSKISNFQIPISKLGDCSMF